MKTLPTNVCVGMMFLLCCISSTQALSQQISLVQPESDFCFDHRVANFGWNPKEADFSHVQISTDQTFTSIITDTICRWNSVTLSLPAQVDTFFWRVQVDTGSGFSSWSAVNRFFTFNPLWAAQPEAWYKADTGIIFGTGTQVYRWDDLSGNNNHSLQNSASRRPDLVNSTPPFGGMSSIYFDGNDFLQLPFSTSGYQAFYAFMMIQVIDPNRNGPMVGIYNNPSNASQGGLMVRTTGSAQKIQFADFTTPVRAVTNPLSVSVPSPYVVSAIIDPQDSMRMYIDGVQMPAVQTNRNPAAAIANLRMGNNSRPFSSEFFLGRIAELIIYDHDFPEPLTSLAGLYFESRYFPSPNLGPDRLVSGFCLPTLQPGDNFNSYLWSDSSTGPSLRPQSSGTYWVETVNGRGEVERDSIVVQFIHSYTEPKDSLICAPPFHSLDVTVNGGGFSYLWNTGDTSSQILADSTGFYFAEISDSFGCSLNTDTVLIEVVRYSENFGFLKGDTSLCEGQILGIDLGNDATGIYLWNTGDTSATLSVDSSGWYTVIGTDSNGCQARDSTRVTIRGRAPVADFISDSVCPGDSLSIQSLSVAYPPSNIASTIWNFPDSSFSTDTSTLWVAPGPGKWNVTLHITTDSNCSASTSKDVVVHQQIQAAFDLGVVCANGLPVQAQNQSVVSPPDSLFSFRWTLKSTGNQWTESEPMFVFQDAAVDTLILWVTSEKGCIDSTSKSIEVFPDIQPDFTFDQTCLGAPTQFIDVSKSLSIVSRSWDMGDGNTYNASDFTHTYGSPGNYPVALTVTNAIGCEDMIIDSVEVNVPPMASFDSDTICEGEYLHLTDKSTSIQDSIDRWQWWLNGDLISLSEIDSVRIADTGSGIISLVITTRGNCSDTLSKSFLANMNPTASFSFSPAFGNAPITINFSNESMEADSFRWRFGDGSTSTLENPGYTFDSNGLYNIQLHAFNNRGCSDIAESEILLTTPDIDIALENISFIDRDIGNGTIARSIQVRLLNLASTPINYADLLIRYGTEQRVLESYSGLILPGQFTDFTFATELIIPFADEVEATCINAENVNGGGEVILENNIACEAGKQTLQAIGPYPSPASDQVNIDFISPDDGIADIRVYGNLGQLVFQKKSFSLIEGFNPFSLDVSSWGSGNYYLEILYKREKLKWKFQRR